MTMSNNEDNNLLEKLKEAFDALVPPASNAAYPSEAMPLGTFVRSTRLDRLGVVADAFYGDVDQDNQKIIVYSVLLFPKKEISYKTSQQSSKFYIVNEYEYGLIGYLMVKPVDMAHFSPLLEDNLFL